MLPNLVTLLCSAVCLLQCCQMGSKNYPIFWRNVPNLKDRILAQKTWALPPFEIWIRQNFRHFLSSALSSYPVQSINSRRGHMNTPLQKKLFGKILVTIVKWTFERSLIIGVAAIAPWFCLRLPSCGLGFKSQAHHLCFFQFVLKLKWEKNENKQKRGQDWPIYFKKVRTISNPGLQDTKDVRLNKSV